MAMTHTVEDVGPSPEDIASALAELENHNHALTCPNSDTTKGKD